MCKNTSSVEIHPRFIHLAPLIAIYYKIRYKNTNTTSLYLLLFRLLFSSFSSTFSLSLSLSLPIINLTLAETFLDQGRRADLKEEEKKDTIC
jgi:hypothetical protein